LFGQQTDLSISSFASDTISESVISSQGRPNLNPGETDVLSSLIMETLGLWTIEIVFQKACFDRFWIL